ncbi:MAG: hypothetical protein HY656_03415 [Acidobacteria bacterium]|nr:hypothetical protein [Acidobacteriota bacterium]
MVGTIIGLVIGTILVGLLVAPAVQRLRTEKENFAGVELPRRRRPFADPDIMEENRRQQTRRQAVERMNNSVLHYENAYNDAKSLGIVIVVLLIALVNIIPFEVGVALRLQAALHVVLTLSVLGLLAYVSREVFPNPGRLFSHEYLVTHFSASFHPENLFDLAQMSVTHDRSDGGTLRISLKSDIFLTGYRFFVVITDSERQRYYFVGYGKVDDSTSLTRIHLASGEQTYLVSIGDFDWRRRSPADVHLVGHLFVFLPQPKRWQLTGGEHPRFFQWVVSEANYLVYGAAHCTWDDCDVGITFARRQTLWNMEDWTINVDVNTSDERTNLRRLLQGYTNSVTQATGMQSQSLPHGQPI